MPNTYIKPEKRVSLALALLHQRSKLNGLVTLFDGRNFIGARGDTLTYDLPGVTKARDYEFRTRTRPVEIDEIYKTSLSIRINEHMTVGNKFTDEEEYFDLTSYRDEILLPQVQALADRFDKKIGQKLADYDKWAKGDYTLDVTDDQEGKGALRKAMVLKTVADTAGVPDRRYLVCGTLAFVWFSTSEATLKYDIAQATTAFRQGVFGRIAGMDIFDASGVIADDEFYVINPSWAVLANAAPMVPQGAVWGARQTYQGWSLRVIRDYDANYLTDRSIVNTFWGLSPIEDEYKRHTEASAKAAKDGSEAGDIVIEDGKTTHTGKNIRGIKGKIVGFSL